MHRHKVQNEYKQAKEKYDKEIYTAPTEEITELEDNLIEAEENLIEWAIMKCKRQGMTEEQATALRDGWITDADKIIGLAMRIQ